MKNERIRRICWYLALACFAVGIAAILLLPSYSFSGCMICFAGCVIAAYLLLPKLAKKHRLLAKLLLVILSVCLLSGVVAAAITGVMVMKASFGDPDADFQYLLVLGCGVNGTEPSRSLQDRIDVAYDYLTAHPDVICIVSGGKGDGENISEAQCMFNELTGLGIAPERIWMEDKATSTRENFAFSMALIEEKTGSRPAQIGVLSSEYHLYRAGMFAREQNVTACGVPAKTSRTSLFINYFVREIVMVWYYSTIGA